MAHLNVVLANNVTAITAYMTYRHYALWDHGKRAMIILVVVMICTFIPLAVIAFIVMVHDIRK